MPTVSRCYFTGNMCGTDTWSKDYPCDCRPCQAYLARVTGHATRVWTTQVPLEISLGLGAGCPGCGTAHLTLASGAFPHDFGACAARKESGIAQEVLRQKLRIAMEVLDNYASSDLWGPDCGHRAREALKEIEKVK